MSFTKNGDLGNTDIFGGKMVSKANLRIRSMGSLEELNASIGMLLTKIEYGTIKEKFIRSQQEILSIYNEIRSTNDYLDKATYSINNNIILNLEKEIKEIETEFPRNTSQFLPGGSEESAMIYWVYALTRKSEREFVALNQVEKINPFILPYLNRLSSWMHLMARYVNKLRNSKEIKYEK